MSQCDNAHIVAIFVVYLLIFIVPQIVIIAHTFIRKMPSPNMLGAICFLSAMGLLVCMFVFFAMRGGVVFHDKLSDTEYGIAQLYKTFFRYPLVYLFATLAIVYSIYAVQQFLHNKDIKQLIVHCIAIVAWITAFIVNLVYISKYYSYHDAITVFAVNWCMTGVAVIAELALLFVLLHKKLKAEKAFQAKKTT